MKKRADGRYRKEIRIGMKDGKPVSKTFYGKTVKEVDLKVREFKSLMDRGTVLSNQKMTIEQLSHEWIENEKKPSASAQYLVNLTSQVKAMNKHIGHIRVQELTTYMVEQYRDEEIAEGHIDQYNKGLAMLRRMLDYAIRHDIIVRNVTVGLPRIKYERKEKRAFTVIEEHLILNAELDLLQRAFIDTLYYTGLRRNEALALLVSDVDFKTGEITVSKTLVQDRVQDHTKTKAGMRCVQMPLPLLMSLKSYCDFVGSGPLFPAHDGGYITSGTFHKRWQAISKKIFGEEVPSDFTPHLFRHNYASMLYKAGIDLKTAQYLLGHDDVETTLNTYTHFSKNDVKIDALNTYFSKKLGQNWVKAI